MLFKGKIIALGTNEWRMDEEKKEGISLFYISEGVTNEVNKKGFFPIKKSFPKDFLKCLDGIKFPHLCDVEFTIAGTVGNKMDINITSISPVKCIELWK